MRRALLVCVAACTDPPATTNFVSPCDGTLVFEANQDAPHVATGTAINWTHNPPTTGAHYQVWAAWNRHYTALDRGYWLHNAEHGGIVMLYRCDAGCPEVVDALLAAARNVAVDPACSATAKRRVIVAADPLLPDGVQVSAVSWQHAYTATCYDPYVEKFAREYYNNAPEDTCFEGASLGGTPID